MPPAPPPIDVERLKDGWPHAILHEQEVDSTNAVAVQWCRSGGELPVLVIADRQRAGRGQADRSWWSDAGSLTFSVVFAAGSLSIPHPCVSLAAACGVAQALETQGDTAQVGTQGTQGDTAQVKWPNDVLLGGRKVAGILIESLAAPTAALVIGIGVNLNCCRENAPSALREEIAVAAEWAGKQIPTEAFLTRLLDSLVRFCRQSTKADVIHYFRSRCYLTGRRVQLVRGSSSDVGTCLGVNDEGQLLIQAVGDTPKAFSSGHIDLVGPPSTR